MYTTKHINCIGGQGAYPLTSHELKYNLNYRPPQKLLATFNDHLGNGLNVLWI